MTQTHGGKKKGSRENVCKFGMTTKKKDSQLKKEKEKKEQSKRSTVLHFDINVRKPKKKKKGKYIC